MKPLHACNTLALALALTLGPGAGGGAGPAGDYLGQAPPGAEPVVFAPGVVSTGLSERDIAITPDGSEIYYGTYAGSYAFAVIMVVRREAGVWGRPEVAPFSGPPGVKDLEPALSWYGKRLYFLSDRPARPGEKGGQDIWYVERRGEAWGPATPLGPPVCTAAEEYFPSLTRDGTLYFTLEGDPRRPDGIYRSRLVDGAYTTPERLPDHVNSGRARYNAFVAPDESYLVYAIYGRPDGLGRSDYFVSFRSGDDVWSEPVNLGPRFNSEGDEEYSPYVTRDGRYFFFMSSRTRPAGELFGDRIESAELQRAASAPGNGAADIWWADASFLRTLRPPAPAVAAAGAPSRAETGGQPDASEHAAIERVIRDNIGWALTKDRALLERTMAHDERLFIFNPTLDATVGWSQFVRGFDFWMDPRFRAVRFDIRELRIDRSRSGDVAWWSCILDDLAEWDGRPIGWKDTRWTGVLERRDGAWLIVQMHFSFAQAPTPPAAAGS